MNDQRRNTALFYVPLIMTIVGLAVAIWCAIEPEIGLAVTFVWGGYALLVFGLALLIRDLRERFF
jgi:uncharacterized membrane protein HdeD (DUF308 family)